MKRRAFLRSAALATAAFPAASPLAAMVHALTQGASDVRGVTAAGKEVTLPKAAVTELGDALRGRLLLPGAEGYDDARRVLNASIDKHPALVAQCLGAADVREAVSFARDHGLLVAVKCGGHSSAGKSTCDGGLLIDLSPLQGVRVDPLARTARVAGGSLLGAMDEEAMAFGLVTTAGTVSHTGVGGLTLGGGYGRVARRFGLSLDNVLGVDIVTADGEFRRAGPEENPDLYWAVRGGGGNFGVVTSFEFRLHPMNRQVIGGRVVFPIEQARQILAFYAEYSAEAPDDLYVDFAMGQGPGDAPGGCLLSVCYSGPPERAEALLAPIRKAGTPVADTLQAVDYVALQKSGDIDDPRALGVYLKAGFVNGLDPALADRLVDGFAPDPERRIGFFLQHCGGAIARVPADATAFPHRQGSHALGLTVGWPVARVSDPSRHIDALREYWATLEPYTDGFYANDVADQAETQIHANYRQNYPRLVAVKNRYDPTNLFRLNANIVPTV
jgi:hypothetical protein